MTAGSGGTVAVWDLPTRLFHWSLAALVVAMYATARLDEMEWHARAGETVLALVLFRLIWGVVGTRTARFADFVRGPRTALRYVLRREPPATAGHNPLGGWMVVALLLCLATQATLGLFSNDDVLFDGPLTHRISKDLSDTLSGLHTRLFWVIVGMAVLHVAAVLTHLWVTGDNLVRPIISGRKRAGGVAASDVRFAPLPRAVLALAVAVGLVQLLLSLG